MRLATGLLLSSLGLLALACGGAHPTSNQTPPGVDAASAESGPDASVALPDAGETAEPDAGLPDASANPNVPGPDYLTPTSADYLTVQFKGLINSQDTVDNNNSDVITGIGEVKASFVGQSLDLTTSDNLYAYDYAYPADYSDPNLAGQHFLILSGYQTTTDSTASKGTLYGIDVSFPTTAALALAADEHSITIKGATIYREDYVVRKDSSQLALVCYQAMANTGSTVFVDHSQNKTFTPGENLIFWANAVEMTDPAALLARLGTKVSNYKGAPCLCYLDNSTFDCANWDSEVAQDGSELSCGAPADFLTPPADVDYASFEFKGSIEAADNPSPKPGYAPGTVSVTGGTSFTAASGYAWGFTQGSDNYVQISFYDAGSGTDTSFARNEIDVVVAASTLLAAKSSNTDPIVIDSSMIVSAIAEKFTGYQTKDNDYLYRICPFAIFRPGGTDGKLTDCPANNTSFAVGEDLEIEGLLVLATDVSSDDVGATLGADGCYCMDANSNAAVDCATLPTS